MNTQNETRKAGQPLGALAGGGGVLAGLGALIGASCCVLPIVLINLGVSAALVSNLAFFAQAKPYFLIAAAVFVAIALVAAARRGRWPRARVLWLLGVAVVLIAGSYLLPMFEGDILRWLHLS